MEFCRKKEMSECVSLHIDLQVEQHNTQVQHGFIQRMDGAFSSMQSCVQQQETQHRSILSKYSQAVGEAALKGMLKLCSVR